jgi:predicted nucleic acid-binding protein
MLLIDTSAWIEFFLKNKKGERVKHYLKTESCYTSIVSIAEISNWASRQKLDGGELVGYVIELTQVAGLNLKIAFLAGELNFQRKKIEKDWGMMDSFILATARIYNLKILTKDSQFRDLLDVEIL